MVSLFKNNFVIDEFVLDGFVEQKNHEDPEGMANLLIQWPNSEKVFECFNFNCDYVKNMVGCEIIQEEAEGIRRARRRKDEKIRRASHNEYVKSLQN